MLEIIIPSSIFGLKFFYRSLIFNVIQHETVLELNAMKK